MVQRRTNTHSPTKFRPLSYLYVGKKKREKRVPVRTANVDTGDEGVKWQKQLRAPEKGGKSLDLDENLKARKKKGRSGDSHRSSNELSDSPFLFQKNDRESRAKKKKDSGMKIEKKKAASAIANVQLRTGSELSSL